MLRWRLISGFIVIAIVVAICWFDTRIDRPGLFLAPLALLACALATKELLTMLRSSGSTPLKWTSMIGTLLPVLASFAPIAWEEYSEDCPIGRLGWLSCGLVAGLALALFGELTRKRDADTPPGTTLTDLSNSVLILLYIGGLIGFLVQLRLTPFPGSDAPSLMPLLSTIFVVKFSDTCQYFVGRLFGRKKLAPTISPGKTWEGAVGGIALCVVISATLLMYYLPAMEGSSGWLRIALFCLLLCIAGIFGDLVESMLKRDAGFKDSSTWLLGLGGVMDILDSLLLAGPVAYACWLLGLIAQ